MKGILSIFALRPLGGVSGSYNTPLAGFRPRAQTALATLASAADPNTMASRVQLLLLLALTAGTSSQTAPLNPQGETLVSEGGLLLDVETKDGVTVTRKRIPRTPRCADSPECGAEQEHVMSQLERVLYGGDPEALERVVDDATGMRALHTAAMHGHDYAAMALVQVGAAAEARDKRGMAPMHWAAAMGRGATVQVLYRKGNATLDARADDGSTPLHVAAGAGHFGVVALLAKWTTEGQAKGELLNLRNTQGLGALHLAAMGGHVACVTELVQRRCDIELKTEPNADGVAFSALVLAAASGKAAVVAELRRLGASGSLDDLLAKEGGGWQTLQELVDASVGDAAEAKAVKAALGPLKTEL